MNFMKKCVTTILTIGIVCSNGCAVSDKPMTREQKIAHCRKKLHKVTSRDDLIKQMYETAYLDDCLFEMQPEELQSIWGVKLRDERLTTHGWADEESPFHLYVSYFNVDYKPYSTNFMIRLNDTMFKTKQGTLFPEGKFPDFLPEPRKRKMFGDKRTWRSTGYLAKEGDFIQHGWEYFWLYRERAFASTGGYTGGAIPSLIFLKTRDPFYYPYEFYPETIEMKK